MSEKGYGLRSTEFWLCEFCNREHPARITPGGVQPVAYCPELGARVYSPQALRRYAGRCP